MRRATVAVVLLGLLAVVSAGDISGPRPGTRQESCLLPVAKIECTRDWRSGFVAGVRLGYNGFDDVASPQWLQICSGRIGNQTQFDMSVAASIDTAQNGAPDWYSSRAGAGGRSDFYFYPASAPITQVIVLHAPNPWGDNFGNIPAILFGYLDGPANNQRLDFAVCGNALYANYFLNPTSAPAPPTPVTLKASFSSGLSETGNFTALGSLEGKCGIRGNGFLGGDPWKNSKLRLKSVKKPCFTRWNNAVQTFTPPTVDPPRRIWANFECRDRVNKTACRDPCHFSKKHDKKGPSFSCSSAGTTLAVGKFGPITFDQDGNSFAFEPSTGPESSTGAMQQVRVDLQTAALDGDVMPDDEE